MRIKEAIKNGIRNIRKPYWHFKNDRLELPILKDGKCGFWMTLHSPESGEAGMPDLVKQQMPWSDDLLDDWEEYKPSPKEQV